VIAAVAQRNRFGMDAQIPGDGVIEAEFTPVDHVGQKDCSKHLRDRGDAKDGGRIHGAGAIRATVP